VCRVGDRIGDGHRQRGHAVIHGHAERIPALKRKARRASVSSCGRGPVCEKSRVANLRKCLVVEQVERHAQAIRIKGTGRTGVAKATAPGAEGGGATRLDHEAKAVRASARILKCKRIRKTRDVYRGAKKRTARFTSIAIG